MTLLDFGQFFLHIPYLFFKLLDHFAKGLATLTPHQSSTIHFADLCSLRSCPSESDSIAFAGLLIIVTSFLD